MAEKHPVKTPKETPMDTTDETNSRKPFEWTGQAQLDFFESIVGHKVAGLEKNFHMSVIHEKFSTRHKTPVTTKELWKQLECFYDLELLDEHQPIPPWNNTKTIDYLPPSYILDKYQSESDAESIKKSSGPQKKRKRLMRNSTASPSTNRRKKP